MSFDKKAYMKNYRRQQYHQRKDAGLCAKCGKVPARPGKALCAECAQQNSASSRRQYALKPWYKKRTGNFKKLLKAVRAAPFEFAAAMNKDCKGGCIMDMFGCSERCEKYQDLTCNDCIRDWLSEDGDSND